MPPVESIGTILAAPFSAQRQARKPDQAPPRPPAPGTSHDSRQAEGAEGEGVGLQGRLDLLVLDGGGQEGEGALFGRPGGEIAQAAYGYFDRLGRSSPYGRAMQPPTQP